MERGSKRRALLTVDVCHSVNSYGRKEESAIFLFAVATIVAVRGRDVSGTLSSTMELLPYVDLL